ncbi:MAG: hypothetical protein H0T73_14205 [Ardenticatenales bacterium]|nr:hypothetical protein [Ardenticatenales bacterium]
MSAHRALPMLLAIVLTLPSLWVGWQFDDYLHREQLSQGNALSTATQRLFVFMDGSPARTRQLMDTGEFPWWALPEGKVAFWRPLTGLTHWLDYQLWPTRPALMHAQNLLWFALLIAVVTQLYQRMMPGVTLAGGATLLYALDDAHGFAVGWLSNRNALLATLFGVLALLAHDRWRRDGWRVGALLSPLLLALGLLSAEAALATVAYLVAHACFLERGGWRGRIVALLPAFATVLLWRLPYRWLGYGAWGTSYIDPASEPLRYGWAVMERVPILLLGQWALPPAEAYPLLPAPLALAWWLAALLFLALLLWALWPLLRAHTLARFWLVGMVLATLPPAASLPANRLLFFVGLGAMGLLALFLAQWRELMGARWVLARLLAMLHLGLAPLLLPLTAWSPRLFGQIEPAIAALPTDEALVQQTLVIVNAPTFFATGYLASIRAFHGQSVPARVRFLGSTVASLEITRRDERTLLVRPASGYLLGFDQVFRGSGHALAVGEVIKLEGMQIEVLGRTEDERPAAVAFRFDEPLEDSSLRWVQWQGGGYVSFTVPTVGETLRLPAIGVP